MQALSQPSEPVVHATPLSVKEKLQRLDIPLELLIAGAQAGFIERQNASRGDPVTKAGTDAWSYPVRVVREGLEARGWRLDDPKNLPLVISDERKINVTVSSGDEMTGVEKPRRPPRSKNPKGVLLECAVERNIGQFDMFPDELPENVMKFDKTLEYPTWVFLLYITDDEIRAELSLPNSIDGSDHLDGWAERIVLHVPLPDEEQIDDTDNGEGAEIVPTVTAKI
ncbi:hypothetical protein [Martelella mediterranea]|uniref:Uncharacterized protein n=1 Tax=Martelella mediterranea TaxID=293089 RepID=A0A4V6P088_9HYPH|nr:hypothetical protein [Martelella mediterranea]TCT37278.1 hypothetical protein EDC90_101915 [Martelella mediterranea]